MHNAGYSAFEHSRACQYKLQFLMTSSFIDLCSNFASSFLLVVEQGMKVHCNVHEKKKKMEVIQCNCAGDNTCLKHFWGYFYIKSKFTVN